MSNLPPRLVIAGTHSGVGKTTVAVGLMAAFRATGLTVGAAKVGPDFIDPGYHSLAVGRPSRNLDIWMCGSDAILPLAGRAGAGCDLLVVEGVMGLFDGAGDGTPSSTADVAVLLDAPVILVVDASSMSQSVAALVHGFASFDPRIRIAGVILNRVGSPGHETMLREAVEPLGLPVVGVLGRDDRLAWRDRHLGLIPVAEDPAGVRASLDLLSTLITQTCDLDAIHTVARAGSAPVTVAAPPTARRVGGARIAVAAGPAFSFVYPDNLEALAEAGAELIPFDPCVDEDLPNGCAALVAGGGFPEVYAAQLSQNTRLLANVRKQIDEGLVVWAECGGLLWLCRQLDGAPMVGAVPTDAVMTPRLTLGYQTAVSQVDSPLGPAGTTIRGHEFHYSVTTPAGDALDLVGRHGRGPGGFAMRNMFASYLHTHLANRPDLVEGFMTSALRLPYGN